MTTIQIAFWIFDKYNYITLTTLKYLKWSRPSFKMGKTIGHFKGWLKNSSDWIENSADALTDLGLCRISWHQQVKAARLQIHDYFHENFENVSDCFLNILKQPKGSDLHIFNGTYNPVNYQKSGLNMHKQPLMR
jgi:hypothetical protein